MTTYNRQDSRSVQVRIDGDPTGIWSTKEGGDGDSEETKIYPGGAQGQVSLGGRPTRENVTVSRYFSLDRDLPKIKRWDGRRGKARVVVTEVFLDADDNAFGTGVTWTGTLKRVAWPPYDSESSDAAKVEIEISTDADVA